MSSYTFLANESKKASRWDFSKLKKRKNGGFSDDSMDLPIYQEYFVDSTNYDDFVSDSEERKIEGKLKDVFTEIVEKLLLDEENTLDGAKKLDERFDRGYGIKHEDIWEHLNEIYDFVIKGMKGYRVVVVTNGGGDDALLIFKGSNVAKCHIDFNHEEIQVIMRSSVKSEQLIDKLHRWNASRFSRSLKGSVDQHEEANKKKSKLEKFVDIAWSFI